MHWAYRIAEKLIARHPDRETFVCASGISPSGSVHIGNFREVVTTFFVVKALQNLGKKTRFIFSWDDFDRFRKVPKNVDPSFKQYIGMPYSEIPCPYGCHSSYADHFEKEFELSLLQFGIVPEFIYQSEAYKSKRYNTNILKALKERKQIYDIVIGYKTAEPGGDEREEYYPVNVYCEACRKDIVHIMGFENNLLSYVCTCSHSNVLDVKEATNIKLNWKIDWPMRWMVEDVVFEPGGRDHSSATGSYRVSMDIASKIFNHQAPLYEPYDFIGIKGTGEKMSSSSGNNITPGELLNIYTPEVILFMFAKYQPSAAFHIGLDDDVVRNYTEFERYRESGAKQMNEDIITALALSVETLKNSARPTFSQVASILPLVNFNKDVLKNVLKKMGEDYSSDLIKEVGNQAEFWIRNWVPKKVISVNTTKNVPYYQNLNAIEQEWIKEFIKVLQVSTDSEHMMTDIYAICNNEDSKIKRNNQKTLFRIIYQLVLNTNSGPRIPILVHSVGKEKLVSLLDFDK
ncbi:lysine--tRNA ligase [Fictibacillus nanhaiensis]|uniref:lysine--tRNA ligase n=1 Tax=Fictibacillus nanhaiensis TaxID=742169 RepID=UPI001C964238|nr:lysine--tRNA ligase [Fictibacillus nanhaiensis]MBY6037639.1 lysine--tRNA ligase [Fictibacillus nanhaiensis]